MKNKMDDVKTRIEKLKHVIRKELNRKRPQKTDKALLASYRIVREQTECMTLDKELDELFAEWLGGNALIALATPKALEAYFHKSMELEPDPTPEMTEKRADDFYFHTGEDGREHIVFRKGKEKTEAEPVGKTMPDV